MTNLEDIVRIAIAELSGASYQVRRKGVMFVSTLLGHRMGPEQLRDQPWGVVGQCENCGQIGKAPRDGTSIEGRAVERTCPAGGIR